MTTSPSDPHVPGAVAEGARPDDHAPPRGPVTGSGLPDRTGRDPASSAALVTDIVVIGAGPAGLAAAVAGADAGVAVVLIDAEPVVGGQFWRHPAPASGADDPTKRPGTPSGRRSQQGGAVREAEVAGLHHDLHHYRSLRRRLSGHVTAGLVTHLAQHEVWALENLDTAPADDVEAGTPGVRFAVHAVTGAPGARRETSVHARSLVLATGAYDLQLPFPGWDLPGVMTAGGVQSLLKGHAVLAGSRVVVAGTGPFLLSVASGLLRSGATVPGVFELARPTRWLREARAAGAAAGKLAEGLGYARDLARRRVRYRTGWTVLSAQGDGQLESVTVVPVDPSGNPVTARARRIDADVLAVGWGFVPQLELPAALGCGTCPDPNGLPIVVVDSDQRSTVPGVYAAGEICGVGGAALAVVEGEIAGGAAAAELTDLTGAHRLAEQAIAPRHVQLVRRRAALRSFADALARVYPVPTSWADRLPDDTLVCRCEEVAAAAIRDAATHDGASDARSVKLLARPGMGWCQGRVCGYATECLVARATTGSPRHGRTERPVASPIPLGVVAGVDRADVCRLESSPFASGQ